MRTTSIVIMLIVSLLASAAWAALAAVHADQLRFYHQATTWPTVQGRVTKAEVTSYRGSKGRTKYRPVVQYTYDTGDGVARTASRIHDSREDGTSSQSSARERIAPYAAGNAVTVYHHPTDRGVAMLEPGIADADRRATCFLLAGLLLVLSFWAMVWHFIRRKGADHVAGVLVIQGPPLRLRPSSIGPVSGGLMAGAALACAVPIATLFAGGPSWWGVGLTLLVGALISALGWWGGTLSNATGQGDVVIDLDAGTVRCPALEGEPVATLPIERVTGTVVRRVVRGSGKSRRTCFDVNLLQGDADAFGRITLSFSTQRVAEQFERYLRAELALDDGAAAGATTGPGPAPLA
jgi:hypothetical protein